MIPRPKAAAFPWVTAAVGALAVVVGGVSLLRFPDPPQPRDPATVATPTLPLQLSRFGSDAEQAWLQEELALRDPTPLFLPTRWNSGQASLRVDLHREPSARFGNFEPKYVFAEEDPVINIPEPTTVPRDALSVVDATIDAPSFRELSQRELGLPPLPARVAQFEVRAAGTGRLLFADVLAGQVVQPPAEVLREFWAPVEMLLAVDAAGVVGRPAVVATSGAEAVDAWALDVLLKQAHIGARLAPGFYRIVIGP